MKIYYSVTDPFPAYRVDLAELFAVELPKLGIDVEWFMAAPLAPAPKKHQFQGQVVRHPSVAAGLRRKLAYWWVDAREILRLVGRRDVSAIQCRDKYWASLVAIVVCKISGKPFFYWCSYPFPEHDAEVAQLKTGRARQLGLLKAAVRSWLLYKMILPSARHVFVQSEQMRRDMCERGVEFQRMTPVPMGVSATLLDTAEQMRAEVVPGRVIYLGTLGAVRRLKMVIEAFALVAEQIPESSLWLVGDGDVAADRAALEALVGAMGLVDRVHFTGFLPLAQAQSLLATAAVCLSPIYPSPVLNVASPTKLVEYLAFGRPVVCNDHPEQSEILSATGAGLCVPWSASDFADAIVKLLTDPAGAERAGAEGPQWVRRHRVYPVIAREVASVYRALLASNSQP